MKTNKKTTILSLLLTVVMVLTLTTGVFADDVPNVKDSDGTTVQIETIYKLAEGLSIPSGTTFKYTATSSTQGALTTKVSEVTFSDSDDKGTLDNQGMYTLTKNATISFEGTWPHAGLYTYTVKEDTSTKLPSTSYEENKTYTMRVYVENTQNGGLEVKTITVANGDEDSSAKVSKLSFAHTYAKTATLTISKETVSPKDTPDVADKTKGFTFGIKFISTPDAAVQEITGKIDNSTEVKCTVGADEATEFTLHHGQTLNFDNLPVGTRYVVYEKADTAGYTPSVVLMENGETTLNKTFSKNAEAKAVVEGKENALVGENANSVAFTNTYENTPLTGILMHNLPFILLIGLGVCAVAVMVISKRRRNA